MVMVTATGGPADLDTIQAAAPLPPTSEGVKGARAPGQEAATVSTSFAVDSGVASGPRRDPYCLQRQGQTGRSTRGTR